MTAFVGYGLYLLPGVAQLVWAARLRDLRLLSLYPSLALYLLFSIVSSAVATSLGYKLHKPLRKTAGVKAAR